MLPSLDHLLGRLMFVSGLGEGEAILAVAHRVVFANRQGAADVAQAVVVALEL